LKKFIKKKGTKLDALFVRGILYFCYQLFGVVGSMAKIHKHSKRKSPKEQPMGAVS